MARRRLDRREVDLATLRVIKRRLNQTLRVVVQWERLLLRERRRELVEGERPTAEEFSRGIPDPRVRGESPLSLGAEEEDDDDYD